MPNEKPLLTAKPNKAEGTTELHDKQGLVAELPTATRICNEKKYIFTVYDRAEISATDKNGPVTLDLVNSKQPAYVVPSAGDTVRLSKDKPSIVDLRLMGPGDKVEIKNMDASRTIVIMPDGTPSDSLSLAQSTGVLSIADGEGNREKAVRNVRLNRGKGGFVALEREDAEDLLIEPKTKAKMESEARAEPVSAPETAQEKFASMLQPGGGEALKLMGPMMAKADLSRVPEYVKPQELGQGGGRF